MQADLAHLDLALFDMALQQQLRHFPVSSDTCQVQRRRAILHVRKGQRLHSQQVCSHSCGLQQRQSRGYHPYKGGLRLWDGEHLQALEQRSSLVQSLTVAVELAWLIHPGEVAPKLRQLLGR